MSTDTAGNEQNPRAFGSPFDDSDADVIFRSSDLFDFHLYKIVLAKSSSVFKDMFSIPQPSPGDGNARPIVDLTENSITISTLLAFCYPMPRPHLEDLEEIAAVSSAAKKYEMEWVYDEMGALFAQSPLVAERPFKAFHIAYSHGLKREAYVAARALLRLDLDKADILADFEDVDLLSVSMLRRLVNYHKDCRSILSCQGSAHGTLWIELMTEEGWGRATSGQWGSQYVCEHLDWPDAVYGFPGESQVATCGWWVDYMQAAVSVLSERPWPPLVCTPEVMSAGLMALCEGCREVISKAIYDFSRVFCEHLEMCVEKVELELPFS